MRKQKKVKEIVSKGDKFGHLIVSSNPYYNDNIKHRRQHVDCICDCGNIRNNINSIYLKRGSVIYYCGFECPLYKQENPLRSDVPELSKKMKIGDKFGKLKVVKEAFYHSFRGESAVRQKAVEVICECGNHKIYREDKVLKGLYKSCGCTWERQEKLTGITKICTDCKLDLDNSLFSIGKTFCKNCACTRQMLKTYNITQTDYDNILKKQNYKCLICQSTSSNTILYQRLAIDHCHKTGKIRGLLCDKCNRGLGYFNDNLDSLQRAIDYLKRYPEDNTTASNH